MFVNTASTTKAFYKVGYKDKANNIHNFCYYKQISWNIKTNKFVVHLNNFSTLFLAFRLIKFNCFIDDIIWKRSQN